MSNGAKSAATANQKVNKEAIRILVQDYGYKIASQLSGIREDRIRQWAHRCNWLTRHANADKALSQAVTSSQRLPIGEAHAERIQGHRERSLAHLAKYAEDSGKKLADSKGNLEHARKFQAIAAGRANLFPEEVPQTAVQVNVLSFAMLKDVDTVNGAATD